ncbi:TetR/AcrR family transcriptional regulator [Actinomadura sp. WMMB 499]|uniref:TetR/AcrR family transcriptional regulator n=1 Tax=Actinomadura sp. WMMB 499 TaxID=1219491 RepID=UPI0012442240|nr:TetR/AcrR family transcriptional regulator [Actinomadura sp. WMMB 499]QFG21470.1 TetR/AcrR family transcriptional regulator [Actinomadura sp. WMMB 499]
MSTTSSRRLPRGRYALAPEEVARIQRERLCRAMADVMAEKGYAATAVEDVLKHAGVSRQTFYRVFSSKQDCFLASFEMACAASLDGLTDPVTGGDDPLERCEAALTRYLGTVAAEQPFARLFLIEVFAAGPEALHRRAERETAMTAAIAGLLGVTDDAGRFTCRMAVSAICAMVAPPVAAGDLDALRAVGPAMVAHVRRLWEAGAFGAGTGPAR